MRLRDRLTLLMMAVLLAAPVRLLTQEHKDYPAMHHHYRFIDLGTLGGPQSIIFEAATRPLNNQGTVTGCADTSTIDRNNPQNPYFAYPNGVVDPYIQHVFRWRDGVLTDLGTLPGGTSSCTQWINEHGVIVGGSTNGAIDPLTGYPEVNAVVWKRGRIHNLGTLGGNESVAFGVNDRGNVVGWALNTIPDPFAISVFAFGATQSHAVQWQEGVVQDLGTLGGPDSAAYFVNERGQVAGQSLTNSIPNSVLDACGIFATQVPTEDPFIWENDTGMTDLGTLGGTCGYPLSLNNRGQVVGQSNLAGDQTFHPFLWDRGVLSDIGTFGGDFGSANWLNDAGEAVGWATYPGNQVYRPFVWENGEMIDLGTVSGDHCGIAFGINSAGQVVGSSGDCQGNGLHAFLWENGHIVDLNNLILPASSLQLKSATNINDGGEIAGTGVLANGEQHAFLLIPCDENHADFEGCDRSFVNTPESQVSPRMMRSIPVRTDNGDLPFGLRDRLRNRIGRRPSTSDVGSPER